MVIVEGIFALHKQEVLDLLELSIYVETDPDVRILRRIQRDVVERDRSLEDIIDQYLAYVKPMHEKFVKPTKNNAEVIIPGGSNQTAVELLRTKIEFEISKARGY